MYISRENVSSVGFEEEVWDEEAEVGEGFQGGFGYLPLNLEEGKPQDAAALDVFLEVEEVHGDFEVPVAGVDKPRDFFHLKVRWVQVDMPVNETADSSEPGLYAA